MMCKKSALHKHKIPFTRDNFEIYLKEKIAKNELHRRRKLWNSEEYNYYNGKVDADYETLKAIRENFQGK